MNYQDVRSDQPPAAARTQDSVDRPLTHDRSACGAACATLHVALRACNRPVTLQAWCWQYTSFVGWKEGERAQQSAW